MKTLPPRYKLLNYTPSSERLLLDNKIRLLSHYQDFMSQPSSSATKKR